MDNPLISVIVPVYNVEKYLDRCVESIVNQTYTNLEIILVDDGSPDNCPAMCDAWAEKDSRIKVIHKENGGLSSARNAGLDIMSGKYIMFVDSDDLICEDSINILFSLLKENDVDLVIGSYYIYDGVNSEGIFSEKVGIYSFDEYWEAFYNPKNNIINPTCFVSACAKLYKKHIFDQVRFPNGKIHEDEYVIHLTTYNCNKIEFIDKPVYYYFRNLDSIMHSQTSKERLDNFFGALKNRALFFESKNKYSLMNKAILYYMFVLIDKYLTLRFGDKNTELAEYIKLKLREEYRSLVCDSVFGIRKVIKGNELFILSFFKHYLLRVIRWIKK